MTQSVVPTEYLGVTIPEDVRAMWWRWEGMRWRIMRYADRHNGAYPQDQRFSVRPPDGMCPVHLDIRRRYRDMHFDTRTCNRWPGHPGSPFDIIGHDMRRVLEERRREWDTRAAEQMQLTERICLRGDSPQCGTLDMKD